MVRKQIADWETAQHPVPQPRKSTRQTSSVQRAHSRRRKHNSHSNYNRLGHLGVKVAPFAIVGTLFVCLLAMIIINQYATLAVIHDEAVDIKREISTLQKEEAKLLAQYELSYDLQVIEQNLLTQGIMAKPQSGQIYTIELSRPDSAEYYQKSAFFSYVSESISEIFSTIGTYF